MKLEYPGTPVPLHSTFYIDRPPTEVLAVSELTKPGALLRLKAPRHMGKSSLLNRLIAQAQSQDYHTAVIDLQLADHEHFQGLTPFLQWVWAYICHQLDIPPESSNVEWDKEIGVKLNTTLLLESKILQTADQPVVLAFNEVNRLFEYPELAQDFLSLLRYWHERAKMSPLFERLRLIVVHSTDVYVQLDLNQSPFNVGLTLELPPFTLDQVQELACRHGLSWAEGAQGRQRLQPLYQLVGGSPYLVRLAFYHLTQGNHLLPDLLQHAATLQGIFADRLRYLSLQLQQNEQLLQIFHALLHNESMSVYDERSLYKLESLGLMKRTGNDCEISCDLYRQFFLDLGKNELPDESHSLAQNSPAALPANGWWLDPVDERLWYGAEPITLPRKTFAMLRYLVENPNRLLSKDELLEQLWPDTYVTEALIKDYIQTVRKVLGDDPKAPRFIENVRGRGYRFIGAIELVDHTR